MAYKKILVCLDGSALAEAARPHAQILASDEEVEITLLRVSVNPARWRQEDLSTQRLRPRPTRRTACQTWGRDGSASMLQFAVV